MLPNKVAVCKCAAHAKEIDDVKTAKEVVQGQSELITRL